MDPKDLQPQEPEVGNVPNQIFDISEDNISPISTDDLAKPSSPQESSENEKRSTPPLEEELLDKKIGTFDPVPFAPPVVPPAKLTTPQRPTPQIRPIKPIRTYEGDVAEVMSHKRTSTASIAIAESKKQQGTETLSNDKAPNHAGKKTTMLLLGLLLLGGGAFGAYYLYSKSALAPATPITEQPKSASSIVPQNSQVTITIDSQSPLATRKYLENEIRKTQAPNTIKEIVVATKNPMGTLTRVSAQDMVKAMDINTPDILTRSLTSNWMLGVYNDPDGVKSVFVVSTTNFFQNTFAGMLQWEQVMADDLRPYLFPSTVEGVSNEQVGARVSVVTNPLDNLNSILPRTGTTTATSSTSIKNTAAATTTKPLTSSTTEIVAPLKQYVTIRGKFEDRIVKNKDVRAFRASTGEILFLYSFIDNIHLLITEKESTLAEVLSRLEKQSFIR